MIGLEDGAGPFFLEGVHRSGDADDERVLALVLLRVRLQVRHRRRHLRTRLIGCSGNYRGGYNTLTLSGSKVL